MGEWGDIGKLAQVLKGKHLQRRTRPVSTRHVAAELEAAKDTELESAFGEIYHKLYRVDQEVGAGGWIQMFRYSLKGSLSEIIKKGEPIPQDRLRQIQIVMKRLLLNDSSFTLDGQTGQYGKRAKELLQETIETVVMGHTHLARHIGPLDRATYINTGTWIDLVRVPDQALRADKHGEAALTDFLRRLLCDQDVREFRPTYADLCIRSDGRVLSARLCEADG